MISMVITKIDPSDPYNGNKWVSQPGWIEIDGFYTFGDEGIYYDKDGEKRIKLSEHRITLK